MLHNPFASPNDVQEALASSGYVCETSLATALYLSLALERPIFLEGEAGVGKTEVAKVLALALNRPLVRLQCYEGIDRQSALYEWNYPKQLLYIRLLEASGRISAQSNMTALESTLFSSDFLMRRPLLQAVSPDGPAPVLLIDEVDRSDEEFEAFLLEILAEYQVTVPEMGTVRAKEIPLIVLTSNRTREVHDALKRRCLYHWVPYPTFEKEFAIVREQVHGISETLSRQITAFVQRLREEPLFKRPGVAETLNWATALEKLRVRTLSAADVEYTIGSLIKYRDDLDLVFGTDGHSNGILGSVLTDIGVGR